MMEDSSGNVHKVTSVYQKKYSSRFLDSNDKLGAEFKKKQTKRLENSKTMHVSGSLKKDMSELYSEENTIKVSNHMAV
jgi:hypothetical protein